MNHPIQILNPIIEEDSELCIELTFFSDILPAIKSYYIMNQVEYEELISLYVDIYIENFIDDEILTKDKLDIHLIKKSSNILICKNFIKLFGNPFDILMLINAKKIRNIETNSKHINMTNDILTTEFSDSDTQLKYENSDIDSDSIEYSERMIRPKNKTQDDKCISTFTDIIDIYNKTQKVDKEKIEYIQTNKPELLKDEILSEILSECF